MFQIPSHSMLPEHMSYVHAIGNYLQQHTHQPLTTASQKQSIIHQLDNNGSGEKFYFITDTPSNTVVRSKGVEQLMGYGSAGFTTRAYTHLIHPAHSLAQALFAYALLEVLAKENMPPTEVMQLTHVSLLALQHKGGGYIYFKQESRPLLLSADGKILQYASEYTVIKPFHHEPYCVRLYDDAGQRTDLETKIVTLVKKQFERLSGFTTQELRILKRYAKGKQMTSEAIAYSFKIEKSTVSVHNKRILDKTEHLLEHRFDNAQKAAAYLKAMCLL